MTVKWSCYRFFIYVKYTLDQKNLIQNISPSTYTLDQKNLTQNISLSTYTLDQKNLTQNISPSTYTLDQKTDPFQKITLTHAHIVRRAITIYLPWIWTTRFSSLDNKNQGAR